MRAKPVSARILTKWVDQHARQEGLAPSRVRNWVSFMILAGALESTGFVGARPRFTIKGGVALELRLGVSGRATRDLDLVLAGTFEPAIALREALSQPYQGFSFQVQEQIHEMPNETVRTKVSFNYLGRAWGTLQVDVSPLELAQVEVELV